MDGCGLDLFSSGSEALGGFCEHGNEPSCIIKGVCFLTQLRQRKDAPWIPPFCISLDLLKTHRLPSYFPLFPSSFLAILLTRMLVTSFASGKNLELVDVGCRMLKANTTVGRVGEYPSIIIPTICGTLSVTSV